MLEINPSAKVRVESAAGHLPVLYIDDFYTDPVAAREFALHHVFDEMIGLYPGRHALLEKGRFASEEERDRVADVSRYVAALLKQAAGIEITPEGVKTDFSVVTTPGRYLVKRQKHPHVDPTLFLCLIYLNSDDMGGTSFWRNRQLDKRSLVTPDDHKAWLRFMETAPTGETRDDYAMVHTDLWEKYYSIEFKFNRFVAYEANAFHYVDCKSVPDPMDIRKCRLTQRFHVMPKLPTATA